MLQSIFVGSEETEYALIGSLYLINFVFYFYYDLCLSFMFVFYVMI